MDKRIDKIWNEGEDGWWAILKDGWTVDNSVGVHEDSKKKLLQRIKNDAKFNVNG